MGFRRSDLQEAFFVPGSHAFRIWGYGTADPLAEVLQPGYLGVGRPTLTPGDLLWVRAGCLEVTPPGRPNGAIAHPAGPPQMALLAVSGFTPNGNASLRLVQDLSLPPVADAPSEPTNPSQPLPALDPTPRPVAAPRARPKKRGRPVGSPNRPKP